MKKLMLCLILFNLHVLSVSSFAQVNCSHTFTLLYEEEGVLRELYGFLYENAVSVCSSETDLKDSKNLEFMLYLGYRGDFAGKKFDYSSLQIFKTFESKFILSLYDYYAEDNIDGNWRVEYENRDFRTIAINEYKEVATPSGCFAILYTYRDAFPNEYFPDDGDRNLIIMISSPGELADCSNEKLKKHEQNAQKFWEESRNYKDIIDYNRFDWITADNNLDIYKSYDEFENYIKAEGGKVSDFSYSNATRSYQIMSSMVYFSFSKKY